MFLGWFDVAVDPAVVREALSSREVELSCVFGDGGRGLITGPGPAPTRTLRAHGMEIFLEGRAWHFEAGDVPVDSDERLLQVASCAIRSDGEELRNVDGGFAMVVMQPASSSLLLATDRFAQRPVYHVRCGEGVVFGSNPAAVAAFPSLHTSIDLQSVFDYFYFHVIPGPRTIYRNIERLEAASCLSLRSSRLRSRCYWRPSFQEHLPDFERKRAEAEVRAAMHASVKRSIGSSSSVGAFLSGGIDSSSVAGNLARIVDGPARAFSIGFDVAGYDETDFARTAASAFGLEHIEYNLTPDDIVDALPRLAGIYGQPFGNASAVPTYICAKLARDHGVDLLLGGDGGDELFGGNQRYAFQWLLGLYQRVPDLLRRTLIEPALLGPDFVQDVPPLRKLRSYVSQARLSLPGRLEGSNLLSRLGTERFFTTEFLSQVDAGHPGALQSSTFQQVQAGCDLNRILGFDFKLTLADNDLPKVQGMSNAAGVEVQFPFLDHALVDLSLALPVSQKVCGTRLRPFFKSAMKDFLPQKILSKVKHGFGLPYGYWLRTHEPLRTLSFDALEALKRRDIVRAPMIDELTGKRLDEHPSYYGSAIWLLVVFELWAQGAQGSAAALE